MKTFQPTPHPTAAVLRTLSPTYAPTYHHFFPGSNILTTYASMTRVNTLIGEYDDVGKLQTWGRCFRKSDDGSSLSTFHNQCDNM